MRPISIVPLVFLFAACGGGDPAPAEPDGGDALLPDGGGTADPPPAPGRAPGAIAISKQRYLTGGEVPTYPDARASFYDARPDYYREAMVAGDCRLFTYESTACGPCSGVCSDDGVCQPWPEARSAGTLAVRGTAAPFDLVPPFYALTTDVPAELFGANDNVEVTASGDVVPGFTLRAGGVEVPALELPSYPLVIGEQAVSLRWGEPEDGARVLVRLIAPNRGHGLPFSHIVECDAADRGELEIPAGMIAALPAMRGGGPCAGHDCPPSSLMRYRRAATMAGEIEVELVVGGVALFGLEKLAP